MQLVATSSTNLIKQIILLLLVVSSIFIIERVGWARPVQEQTVIVLQPIEYLGVQLAQVLAFPMTAIEQKHLDVSEVAQLKKSYAQALARLSELESVERENQALRAVIEQAGERTVKKKLAAPVLSYATTAIALGSDDGLEPGALVYISDVLIGQIREVSRTQSIVSLFTSRDMEPVLVQTESGVQGLLVGTGKRVELTQVPVQFLLNPGERVMTVGQPGVPAGQFVGVIATVMPPATAPMQTAIVDQLHSFYTVPLVEVR